MPFHIPIIIILISVDLMGGNAFIRSFPIRQHVYSNTINSLVARCPIAQTAKPTCWQPRNNVVHIMGAPKYARRYHERTRPCYSALNNDALEKAKQQRAGTADLSEGEDSSRDIRRKRLHYHLKELGVDAEAIADAAFRSVTTTGNYGLLNCIIPIFATYLYLCSL